LVEKNASAAFVSAALVRRGGGRGGEGRAGRLVSISRTLDPRKRKRKESKSDLLFSDESNVLAREDGELTI
jgi:hypothetical protein